MLSSNNPRDMAKHEKRQWLPSESCAGRKNSELQKVR